MAEVKKKPFQIFAVSDATGELAYSLAVAASRQFEGLNVKIVRRGKITNLKKIQDVLQEVKTVEGVILFTMVSHELRPVVLKEAKEAGVVAMDVMGPVLDMLSHYFHTLPSDEPGLQYRMTQDYFKRTEAVEFTVRHDEGSGLDTIDQADIVLIGISRSSKTPLSIFLAHQGYKCANVPLAVGMELPAKIKEIDRKKLAGLIVQPEKLAEFRAMRLQNLGRPDDEEYAQLAHIEAELKHAQEVFSSLPGICVVDVTGKAIEEVATEIIHALGL
jgi:regulator of PEP synthase PpsR (kinase-PPPase family)